jgi:hypothetical protein
MVLVKHPGEAMLQLVFTNTLNVTMNIAAIPTGYSVIIGQVFSTIWPSTTSGKPYFFLRAYQNGQLKTFMANSTATASTILTTSLALNTDLAYKITVTPFSLNAVVTQGTNTWSITYPLEGTINDLYFKSGAYCQIPSTVIVTDGIDYCQLTMKSIAVSHKP